MVKRLATILLLGCILLTGFIMPFLLPTPVVALDYLTIYADKDTTIIKEVPTNNYWDSLDLWACGEFTYGEITYQNKIILEFNGWESALPEGAVIVGATLRLYYYKQTLNPTYKNLHAYRMLRTEWWQTSATWNQYKFGSDWTTAGGWGSGTDYTTTGGAWAPIPASYGWVEWNVASQVQWAKSNGENIYIIIGEPGGWSTDGQAFFRSRDYTGTSYDPQLVIGYYVPPPPVVVPTVSTQSATSVSGTSATLRGYLNDDGGEDCAVYFQYGTTTAYGSATAPVGGYDTGDSISKVVYGLLPGTLYHFRVQASNAAGTTSGSDQTFATFPNAPYNFSATAGNAEVVLAWTKGTGADKTMVRRSTVTYPSTPSSGTQAYFDTGAGTTDGTLTNGTPYYYSAWSYANGVYSLSRASDSATPLAPAVPTVATEAATAVGVSTARVNMQLTSMGGAAEVDVSIQYYKDGAAAWGSETTPDTYYATGLYYDDLTGLDAASLYHFRAKGDSTTGIGYGDSESFTTGGLSAPTMTTQAATGVTRTSGTLNAKVADDGGASATVWFEWGQTETDLENDTGSLSGLITDDLFYYGLTNLQSDTTYYYRAIGQNTEGIGYGVVDDFTTGTAAAPTVRSDAAVPGANQAVLHGTLLTDGNTECEVRFQWGTNTGYGTDTAWLPGYESGEAFDQLIIGLDIATTYHYRAQAQNEGGVASGSDATFITVFTSPLEFRAKAMSSTTITLGWVQMGDMALVRYQTGSYPVDREDGIQAYFGAGTTASVSGLEAGTTFYFRAWSWREGNVWSTNYTGDVATTLSHIDPSGEERPVVVTTPDTPSRWFQIPSGAALENMPLYDQLVTLADSMGIPTGTWFFGMAVLMMVVVGGLLYFATRKITLAIVAAAFVVIATTFVGMMPLWFLLVFLVFAGGMVFVERRI